MEVVIKIDDEVYNEIKNEGQGKWYCREMDNAIRQGTPLPKHHGRLIDADAYIDKHAECGWLDDITVDEFNKITPTIIPATRGEENGSSN